MEPSQSVQRTESRALGELGQGFVFINPLFTREVASLHPGQAELEDLDPVTARMARPRIGLAQRRRAGDRNRLLLAMVDMCATSEEARRPELRGLLGDVFTKLAAEAEREIRKALAE